MSKLFAAPAALILVLVTAATAARGQATRPADAPATRPAVRIVENLLFLNKPIAVDGLPAAAEVSPSQLNSVRSRLNGRLLARDDYWGRIDRRRLADHLARVPGRGVVYVNTEGDPRVEYALDKPAADNHKAFERIRNVIHAVRETRPDVQILLDCRPFGRLSYNWYGEGPAKPNEAADYAAMIRDFRRTLADDDAVDGLCFQAYFVKRWQDRFHNDFNGPMRIWRPAGAAEPSKYPALPDDADFLTRGEPERAPEFIDLLNTTTGWAHETRLSYLALQQYGKPVSVIFAPGYGWMSRAAWFNTPLSDADRDECVRKLRALGPANIILFGTVIQGRPVYTDGPDNGASYVWDESAPWLNAWRAEARR